MNVRKAHPNLWRLTTSLGATNALIGLIGLVSAPFTAFSVFSFLYFLLGIGILWTSNFRWLRTRTLLLIGASYNTFWTIALFMGEVLGTSEDPVPAFAIVLFAFFAVAHTVLVMEPPFNPMTGDLEE